MKSRTLWLIGLLALFTSACASTATISLASPSEGAPPSEGTPPSEVALTADQFDEVRYCEAIVQLDNRTRPEAELIDAAIAAAPPEHKEAWRFAAQTPEPGEVAPEDFQEATLGLIAIFQYAEERCGIDFGNPTPDSGGSVSFERSGSSQGSTTTGTDGSGGGAYVPTGPGSEPHRPILAGDASAIAAAINSQVPRNINLAFDWQRVSEADDPDKTARILAPIGWEIDFDSFGVEFSSNRFGFFTDMEISAACQGICQAQNWVDLMNTSGLSPFSAQPDEAVLIVQQLSNPTGRLMVTRNGLGTSIEVARWSNQADKFFRCQARMDEDDEALWQTFADVCVAAVPEWF